VGKGAKATGAALVTRRLAGCLDVASGAVIARQLDRFTLKEMDRFFTSSRTRTQSLI